MRNKHDPPTKPYKVTLDMKISHDQFLMCYKEALQVMRNRQGHPRRYRLVRQKGDRHTEELSQNKLLLCDNTCNKFTSIQPHKTYTSSKVNHGIIQLTKHRYENHILVKRKHVPHEIQNHYHKANQRQKVAPPFLQAKDRNQVKSTKPKEASENLLIISSYDDF